MGLREVHFVSFILTNWPKTAVSRQMWYMKCTSFFRFHLFGINVVHKMYFMCEMKCILCTTFLKHG